MSAKCPFCCLPGDRVILETELLVGLWDGFPVSPGHALLVPRRHVETWFEISPGEQAALVGAIDHVRERIEQAHSPDAYNIGVNSGEAAGQTVPHVHLHIIPRYQGDVEDPRGGVRWVIPDSAVYWDESG